MNKPNENRQADTREQSGGSQKGKGAATWVEGANSLGTDQTCGGEYAEGHRKAET